MTAFHLISADLCPFVQRSVITLREKGVDYKKTEIDLANKPGWFLEKSPTGKVPMLEVDGALLFESAVINEYLDEVTGTPLHPADPLEKAQHRAWIELVSAGIVDAYIAFVSPTEEAAREKLALLGEKLDRLTGAKADGPYFTGDAFSLVDAAMAPLLMRVAWMDEAWPDVALLADRPVAKAWHEALVARPAVSGSVPADARTQFFAYLAGRGTETRNVEPSYYGRRALDAGLYTLPA